MRHLRRAAAAVAALSLTLGVAAPALAHPSTSCHTETRVRPVYTTTVDVGPDGQSVITTVLSGWTSYTVTVCRPIPHSH